MVKQQKPQAQAKTNLADFYFGPYMVSVDGNHCVIQREDGQPAQPSFYEMQHIKCQAFGAQAVAVEVFPRSAELVDGQHQRHLFLVNADRVPNLRTGHLVKHDRGRK